MGLLTELPSFTWSSSALVLLTFLAVVWIQAVINRLYLSPIAHFPGPSLAALTWWYEFYHDVLRGGQYTFQILRLHERYGPIIRINPREVHIADHAFFNTLYTSDQGHRRHKWEFYARQFSAEDSVFSTVDHSTHYMRRAALIPYFSAAKVRDRGAKVVNTHVKTVLRRLYEYLDAQLQQEKGPLDLAVVFAAFTNDVINEYALGPGSGLLDRPDFGYRTYASIMRGTEMGTLAKHAPWMHWVLDVLPDAFTETVVPGWGEFNALRNMIRARIGEMKTGGSEGDTVFHGLLASGLLPEAERAVDRLAQEGQVLNQGGTLTASNALCIAVFHLLDQPGCLLKLRKELFDKIRGEKDAKLLAKLQSLPYLTAVIKESLRLGSGGTSTRLGRVAPDETLRYVERTKEGKEEKVWEIPPGIAVSMTPHQILMDEDVFPDPSRFDPNRWLGGDTRRQEEYYIVFKAGARSCLGKSLALAEMYLMLGQLFLQWGGGEEDAGVQSSNESRPGCTGRMRLFETTVADTQMAADRFVPVPFKGSKGVRVVLEATPSETA